MKAEDFELATITIFSSVQAHFGLDYLQEERTIEVINYAVSNLLSEALRGQKTDFFSKASELCTIILRVADDFILSESVGVMLLNFIAFTFKNYEHTRKKKAIARSKIQNIAANAETFKAGYSFKEFQYEDFYQLVLTHEPENLEARDVYYKIVIESLAQLTIYKNSETPTLPLLRPYKLCVFPSSFT